MEKLAQMEMGPKKLRWQAAAKASCVDQLFVRAERPGQRDSETFRKEAVNRGCILQGRKGEKAERTDLNRNNMFTMAHLEERCRFISTNCYFGPVLDCSFV